MAQADWRRYYLPVWNDGTCGGFTFDNREQLLTYARRVERYGVKLIGIIAAKGKDVPTQRALFAGLIR